MAIEAEQAVGGGCEGLRAMVKGSCDAARRSSETPWSKFTAGAGWTPSQSSTVVMEATGELAKCSKNATRRSSSRTSNQSSSLSTYRPIDSAWYSRSPRARPPRRDALGRAPVYGHTE